MKTITVKGKVYEVGKLYRSEATFEVGYLGEAIGESFNLYQQRGISGSYIAASSISEITEAIGTIKDAPIELEDGEWYMCEDHKGRQAVLHYVDNKWLDSRSCPVMQIAPLYKMVKA